MEYILEEIQTASSPGSDPREHGGETGHNAIKRGGIRHEIECGQQLRAMMPWLGKSGKLE